MFGEGDVQGDVHPDDSAMDRSPNTRRPGASMLSIGRLGTTGGAEYYLDKVANNVDDYYLGGVKRRGSGSERPPNGSGSSGEVDADALRNLLAGKSATGDDLGAQAVPRNDVPATT